MILDKIVEYTNIRLNLKKINARPVTLNEIKAFIGLLILFGFAHKSKISINFFWSKKSCHGLRLPLRLFQDKVSANCSSNNI